MVFQAEWDGGKAYLSWSGGTAITRSDGFAQSQGPILELGKRFADMNGIKMGQQVNIIVSLLGLDLSKCIQP